MERIEKYQNDLGITGWHPKGLSEVERREELEVIGRVIGLLERVVTGGRGFAKACARA